MPDRHVRSQRALAWVNEALFVFDMVALALLGMIIVTGEINPLDSPVLTGFLAASLLIATTHHLYTRRHRAEILASPQHHHDRERRGF